MWLFVIFDMSYQLYGSTSFYNNLCSFVSSIKEVIALIVWFGGHTGFLLIRTILVVRF